MGGGPVVEAPYLVGYQRSPYSGMRLPIYRSSFPISRSVGGHFGYPGSAFNGGPSAYSSENLNARTAAKEVGRKTIREIVIKDEASARLEPVPVVSSSPKRLRAEKSDSSSLGTRTVRSSATVEDAPSDGEVNATSNGADYPAEALPKASPVKVGVLSAQTVSEKHHDSVFDGADDSCVTGLTASPSVRAGDGNGIDDAQSMEVEGDRVTEEVFLDEDGRLCSAATRVQAAFRGYAVRRTEPLSHLRDVAKVKAALNVLEMRVMDAKFQAELCRQGSMEKLRFVETTMALLFQLDAIQGVHPVVREIRKSVTREIISLQERVDAIV